MAVQQEINSLKRRLRNLTRVISNRKQRRLRLLEKLVDPALSAGDRASMETHLATQTEKIRSLKQEKQKMKDVLQRLEAHPPLHLPLAHIPRGGD